MSPSDSFNHFVRWVSRIVTRYYTPNPAVNRTLRQ